MMCDMPLVSFGQVLQGRYRTSVDDDVWYASCIFGQFMLPKRRFWTVEQTVWRVFSKHFSTSASPNPVLTPLKSASKRHDRSFVPSSKILVWGAYNCYKADIAHRPTVPNQSMMCDMHIVILAKCYKAYIAHQPITRNRSMMCDMHIVTFGQVLQGRYRTSPNCSKSVDVWYASCDFLAHNLCSPNEDFGRSNTRLGVRFRCSFRWFFTQIEYSHPWKVLRKDTPFACAYFQKFFFWGAYNYKADIAHRQTVPNRSVTRSGTTPFNKVWYDAPLTRSGTTPL